MADLKGLLRKLGVNSFSELNDEEKKTFKQWEDALRGRKLTDEDVSVFLQSQLDESLARLKPDLDKNVDLFLKMKIEFILAVRKFLATPQIEKQAAEAAIQQML